MFSKKIEKKKKRSHVLWPIAREDDWILYVNNFKCVEQSNFNMIRPPIDWMVVEAFQKSPTLDKVVVAIGVVTKLVPNSLHKGPWLLHRLHVLGCLVSKEFHNTFFIIICISSCKGYAPLMASSKQQEVKYEMFHKVPPPPKKKKGKFIVMVTPSEHSFKFRTKWKHQMYRHYFHQPFLN